ncbi:tetratricopeptide repeat-containing sensor histidine kinase [Aestuariibaculum sediminum]|uniref:histidine kinase n=1 Tax=Aestuariibaculum sediminum TaxID=2770637 RepID=A0A8J6Q9W0_9FLAO|nr:hypothetical protein [Aestuariibaculum sediminum]MBD0831321.1 hypothetical protein [Aestuariibaculum sediminum]
MKQNTFSLLFYCLITFILPIIFGYSAHAQQSADSSLIYYNSITELKDIKLTSHAFDYFKRKAENALNDNEIKKAAYYYELIALGEFKIGFYYESETTAIKALRLLDKIENEKHVLTPKERLYNHLGMVYRHVEDFENSNTYYKKALNLNTDLSNKIAIITNVGNNYADQENYKAAVATLLEFYNQALTINNDQIKSVFLDNLGYYKSKINDSSALTNLNESLKLNRNNKDLTRLFSNYRHLSLYYIDRNQKNKALRYLKKMDSMSNLLQSPKFELETLKTALKLEDNPIFKSYLTLSDSIKSDNLAQENKFAAIQYNVEQKEKLLQKQTHTLEVSELEKEKEKNLKLLYLSLGALITVISLASISIIKIRHKKDKVQEVYLTETRISKKVHDEVANDVYQVMTVLQNQNDVNENILDDLEAIYLKTRDISKENSTINISNNYAQLLEDLFTSYKTNSVNVFTRGLNNIDWNKLDKIKKITLYRVLQELMVNMKKHSKASNVALTFNQLNNHIQINYADNGQGSSLKKGSGLSNMENRIQTIRGTIIFDTELNKGFKAKIKV